MQDAPEPEEGAPREALPRIPGYLIEGVLGRGGSSVVYRARQRSVDRAVALKVLHLDATRRTSTVKRLRREARLMAMLDHPAIVSAFDVGESPDGWWMAMELIEGQPLSEHLRRGGPMGEAEAVELFSQLAAALQHAHEAGVIHRDVKPANVILTASGEPRLVDLGLARSEDEPQLTRLGATMGTPHYVSPEQARNPADVDPRSDVYSLAATMHHALCGEPPFPGESPAEVLASVLHDPLSDPRETHPGVSKGMSLVLRKALSKDPMRRHASARELAMDLKLLMRGKRPRVQTARLEPLEGSERRRTPYAFAALALALIGAAYTLGGSEAEITVEPVSAVKTALESLEEEWRGGELSLREGMSQHASVAVGAREVVAHERLGVELRGKLDGALSTLRMEADAARAKHLLGGRYEEARESAGADFDSAVQGATGFQVAALPDVLAESISRWRARAEAEVEEALSKAYREAGAELRRWAERTLWPKVRERTRMRDFVAAQAALAQELSSYLERASVRSSGLEIELLEETVGWRAAEETRQRLSYELDKSWRELNEELTVDLKRASEEALRRLESGDTSEASLELEAWAREHFSSSGLLLDDLPEGFSSKAADVLEVRLEGLVEREVELAMRRELEAMQRLDEGASPYLEERKYSALARWLREERETATPSVQSFIDLRLEEAALLELLMEDARAAVLEGVASEISLREGGSKIASQVRLEGDPVFERFWVSIAPGSERAWRLGGPRSAEDGVRRVSRVSLEGLSGRDAPCLEIAFLRLAEGDLQAAGECYAALDAAEAATRLGDELGVRLKPLLARESSEERERRARAERWVQTHELEQLMEGSPKKSLKMIETFLRNYADALDAERLTEVRGWRAALEEVTAPSTLDDFEQTFGPDELSFPRRGRVEIRQRFDSLEEGAWSMGSWTPQGLGWQAPLQPGVKELVAAKAPTLLLRDPFELEAGPVEVEVELEVPLDARARLVVVSAIGFHCALVTEAGGGGRLVAGSRDLSRVIERAMSAEGEAFGGLLPGERYSLRMRANQSRGTLTVSLDGAERVRIEDLSPKDRARSTSVSLRSLEPLLLLGVRVEAGRR